MKEIFLNKYMNIIINNNPNFSDEQFEKIRYGIEGIYLTITKLIIIMLLGYLLVITKELLILLFFYNILRFFGFGYHAKSSKQCLLFSVLFFVIFPYLIVKKIIIFKYYWIIITICIFNFLLFAPSDTKKRPMFNKKKRMIRKISLITLTLVYFILTFVLDETFSSMILLSIIIQTFMVNPTIYLITNEPYNNYKSNKQN